MKVRSPKRLGSVVALLVCILSAALAGAQIAVRASPLYTIGYRGYLEDNNGPVQGTADFVFRLYDAAVDGNRIGDAISRTNVPVSKGAFSVELEIPPVTFAQTALWLEIAVNGGEPLHPRQRLLSQAYAANGVPAGSLSAFAGGEVPPGWLACDGSALKSSAYPALFAAIGKSWGDGSSGLGADAATDFNLPDLRGMFLRGADLGAGRDPEAKARTPSAAGSAKGDSVGSLQLPATALPSRAFTLTSSGSHAHGYDDNSGWSPCASPANTDCSEGESGVRSDLPRSTREAGAHTHTVAGGDAETRPKNAAVLYMIKY